jgi:hypothetical protein
MEVGIMPDIRSKPATKEFRDNFDRTFRGKEEEPYSIASDMYSDILKELAIFRKKEERRWL